MSGAARKTFKIVRQVNLDDATLKKVAEALGIPADEHDRIISISGEIQIGPAPTPAGGTSTASGGPPSSTDTGSQPNPPSGGPSSSGTNGGGC